MYFETYNATEAAKLETERAERRAAEAWRFRKIKPRSSKLLNTVLTSLTSFLVG